MSDWFEEWFGEEYLEVYPHRDDSEAAAVVEFVLRRIAPEEGSLALDLACGAGRHQRPLTEHWHTVGLDLSPSLLRIARHADADAPLVRADMRRLPFGDAVFTLVVNLFTSFGYFQDDEEHGRVLREVARVTRPGGTFVLDFLNPAHVRRTLVPFDVRNVGSRQIIQEREISPDGRFVRKTITVGDLGRTFVERVRLFPPDELRAMLLAAGFEVTALVGDYAGAPHDEDSTRAIYVARRP